MPHRSCTRPGSIPDVSYHILRQTGPPSSQGSARGRSSQGKTRTSRSGFSIMGLPDAGRKTSGNRPDACAHQADTVEVGLFPGAFFGAFARLIALVQELDFLELLEGFAQQALGVLELDTQFVGGAGQV